MDYQLSNLFPAPLYIAKFEDEFTVDELNFISRPDLYEYSKNFLNKNKGSDSLNILNFQELHRIKKFIQEHLDNFRKNVMCIENTLFPTISWLNKNPNNTDHFRHFHVNSIVSGVFYMTDDPAPIEFFNETNLMYNPLKFYPNKINEYNSTRFETRVQKKHLIIFPSYIDHAVKKNICSQDRISLSFNTWTDGTIGTLMGSDYLNLDNPQMHDVPMFDLDIRKEQK
jgi:uncharacterized protein (TIGR02466 family)